MRSKMPSGCGNSKRKEMDITQLMMNDYEVETIDDGFDQLIVLFHGPKESLYAGGVWKVLVRLPNDYPYGNPSVKFLNKIFHPNIDGETGFVCLDVLEQSWNCGYDLMNIFEHFLPQLLLYPNASDPLNEFAAEMMIHDNVKYAKEVKDYLDLYAKKENLNNTSPAEEDGDSDKISDGHCTSSADDVPEPEDS
ncbi:hypothetical protein Pfo_011192 [Paulownia fortunei]|nr:hypothetical protein Pfo_011192 [Paulownia fortunei]